MKISDYTYSQRLLEVIAIVLFGVLATWSMTRLTVSTVWYFPLFVLIAAPCGWLASDLLSGVLHWVFDSFGNTTTPLIGKAFIRPFREHHTYQNKMIHHDFVETHGASCMAALPFLVATGLMPLNGWPTIFAQALLLFIALGALATNQCHKWAHMDETATPALIRWAQRWQLVLPREQHLLHHTPPFDSHFCMSCGWFNTTLNRVLRAWR